MVEIKKGGRQKKTQADFRATECILGKRNRGLSVNGSLRNLVSPDVLAEDDVKTAVILGLCVDVFQDCFTRQRFLHLVSLLHYKIATQVTGSIANCVVKGNLDK